MLSPRVWNTLNNSDLWLITTCAREWLIDNKDSHTAPEVAKTLDKIEGVLYTIDGGKPRT